MGLQALQDALARAIRAPERPDSSSLGIRPGGTLDADGALGVYRDGYTARLTEALGETFEAVWWVLGDEGFFSVCRRYIYSHPSRETNLSVYGEPFAAFVAAQPEADGLPFVGDLALFEWKFQALFHAPAHQPAGEPVLTKLTGAPDAWISIGSAVFLFESLYAIHEIWKLRKQNQDDYERPDVDAAARLVAFKAGTECAVRALSHAEFAALGALMDERPLSEALECAIEVDPGFDADAVASFFHTLASAGLIADVRVAGEPAR